MLSEAFLTNQAKTAPKRAETHDEEAEGSAERSNLFSKLDSFQQKLVADRELAIKRGDNMSVVDASVNKTVHE